MTGTYTYIQDTEGAQVERANAHKRMLLGVMEADGLIESAEAVDSQYLFIVIKKGRFGAWWDKYWRLEKQKNSMMTIIKVKTD